MNPPICAKLSTWGRIPTAKLIAIMTKRVKRAAAYKHKRRERLIIMMQTNSTKMDEKQRTQNEENQTLLDINLKLAANLIAIYTPVG